MILQTLLDALDFQLYKLFHRFGKLSVFDAFELTQSMKALEWNYPT